MEKEFDLRTVDWDTLIDIIIRQQAIIDQLEKRIAQLEGQARSKGSGRMPALKPKADRKPVQPKKPLQRRSHGFARVRMTPTGRWSMWLSSVPTVSSDCPAAGPATPGK